MQRITNRATGMGALALIALSSGCDKDSFSVAGDGGTNVASFSEPVKDLALGARYSCALLESGRVRCWGSNAFGQLGQAFDAAAGFDRAVPPSDIPDLSGVTALAAGQDGVCAVRGGGVLCWGARKNVSSPDPAWVADSALRPVMLSSTEPLGGVSAVSGKARYFCALRTDGTVVCWGDTNDNDLKKPTQISLAPTVIHVAGVRQVVAGGFHACALKNDGAVVCWGSNGSSQLGVGSADAYTADPSVVPGLEGVVELSAGYYHTCARTNDGSVYCWGRDEWSQAGVPTSGARTVIGKPVVVKPTRVDGLSEIEGLASGYTVSCAKSHEQLVYCWGVNGYGQLGSTNDKLGLSDDGTARPVLARGLRGVTRLSVGAEHACVLQADEAVKCWGRNWGGTITADNLASSSFPVRVPNLAATQLTAGTEHFCAIRDDKTILCWGQNSSGQLGNGKVDGQASTSVPKKVSLVEAGAPEPKVTQLATGYVHTCALAEDKSLRCWGGNLIGAIGRPGAPLNDAKPTPVSVSGPLDEVAAYKHSTCVRRGGGIVCIGESFPNAWGSVKAGDGKAAFGAQGLFGRCARVFRGGLLYVDCWSGDQMDPVQSSGDVNVASNALTTCFWAKPGGVSPPRCYGNNEFGQAGVGSLASSVAPSPDGLGNLSNLKAIYTGFDDTCAIRDTDTVKGGVVCWGKGWLTGTNDPKELDVLSPPARLVPGLSNITQVAIGREAACALQEGGASGGPVFCWGRNGSGELGDGSRVSVLEPTNVEVF